MKAHLLTKFVISNKAITQGCTNDFSTKTSTNTEITATDTYL